MKKLLFIFFILNSCLFSKEVTLEFLNSKPTSTAKDYYIWRFLGQDINKSQAEEAFLQTSRIRGKILNRYQKRFANNNFKQGMGCLYMRSSDLLLKSTECMNLALSTHKIMTLPSDIAFKVRKKTDSKKIKKKIDIFHSKKPFKELVKSDKNTILSVFNGCGAKFRKKHFNHKLSIQTLNKIKDGWAFKQFVKLIVTTPKLVNLQKSLLIDLKTDKLKHETAFFLGINAIKYQDKKLALNYFDIALKQAYYRFDKDKSIFWKYLITKDKSYLKSLLDSFDVNIYTLYAYETFKLKPTNIINKLVLHEKDTNYDVTDPFSWLPNLKKTKNLKIYKDELVKKFNYQATEGHLAYIYEKDNNYKIHYYITPYLNEMKYFSKDRKALILSLARQESRFIPSSISRSYALGLMQIMPFLSKAIAKQREDGIDLDDMLNPAISIRYANYHLNHDLRKLKHPLFVAYAYNGGVGYMRSLIKKGLFGKGIYEPFLSMELLQYDETKRYGKKVLANYVVYKDILGEKISLINLLKNIK